MLPLAHGIVQGQEAAPAEAAPRAQEQTEEAAAQQPEQGEQAEQAEQSNATKELAKALIKHLKGSGEHVYADRVRVVGAEFDAVTGTMVLEDGILYINDIEARFYGGTAQAAVTVNVLDGTVTAKISFENLQLNQFLTRYGNVESPPSAPLTAACR